MRWEKLRGRTHALFRESTNMKTERHHWWPKCVSKHWEDAEGGINWLRPDGSEKKVNSSGIASINNGHSIKFGRTPEEKSPWDENFESIFQIPDSNFPGIIEWIETFSHQEIKTKSGRERFITQNSSNKNFLNLIEAITSLAIRSPMTRENTIKLAEKLRGPLQKSERNRLISLNLRDMHKNTVQSFAGKGKITIIFQSMLNSYLVMDFITI